MSIELIYRTSDPRAVAWMRDLIDRRNAVREKRAAYEERMTAEFGPMGKRYSYSEYVDRRPLVTRRNDAAGLACGVDEQPPADSGWRLDSKTAYWLPKLATKAGKKRGSELAELRMPNPDSRRIGVEEMHWGEGFLYWPTYMLREDLGEVWVAWGAYECRSAMLDPGEEGVVWVEVPRSEWYAWREAVEAGTAQEALS